MRTLRLTVPVAVACVAIACHHAPPQVAVAPKPNADSLDAARRAREAAERARQDSITRAAAAARAARERADSIAAQQAAEARMILGTMTHFDFDKSDLRPEDQKLLDQKLAILRANPSLRIRIVGNCDERGSVEYNIALGNRRAIAAKDYLVDRGVDATRIALASNGKEHPVDPAHNEQAWAMNRNDQFEQQNPSVVLRMP